MSSKSRSAKRASSGQPGAAKSKDQSEFVYQNDKIDFDLNIRPFKWTEKQQIFIDTLLDKQTNFVFCQSPPGTGKTLLSTFCALKLLESKHIGNIFFARNPVESASRGIGFLGGSFSDKMLPYFSPMMDHLHELLPTSQVNRLIEKGFVQTIPMGFLKGRTFNASLIIADEAEDLTLQELLLCMTRLGKFSKMAIIGDYDQANVKNSGFQQVFEAFDCPEAREWGIHALSFSHQDIMRNKVLQYVAEKFRNLK